jgi:hypothetical protein
LVYVWRAGVIAFAMLAGATTGFAQRGAIVPWTTYEAENMTINGGTVLGPGYVPTLVQSESSGRECVELNGTNQYIQFTAQAAANAIVVRYSVPDTTNGTGTNYTLSLFQNGRLVEELPMTSLYSWLYGAYPFTNDPSAGSPRNFYDEVRAMGLAINPGDVIRLEKGAIDTAAFYDIDLVDLEEVGAPLSAPSNSVSIVSFGADGTGVADSTAALQNAVAAANSQGTSVWMPAGTYLISANMTLPSNTTIQGAGMWYTTLVGNPLLYTNPANRIAFNGQGNNIHLSDFAIIGKLNYRSDSEPNDGLGGSYGTGSSISRIWVEHTKTGAWIMNSKGLVIDGCRFRDTLADGCNINVGMQSCLVTNCASRGTGDDCFAMWPAIYTTALYKPGSNVFTHCTGELNFLANGGALYGAQANVLQDSLFQDITYGCGILISSTFAVGTNEFNGTTTAQRCNINRCGGSDPGFGWRAAVQICVQLTSISGVNLNNLEITNSVSDGFSIICPVSGVRLFDSAMADVSIPNYGIGVTGRNGLWAAINAEGSLTVSDCAIVEHSNASPTFSFTFDTNTAVQAMTFLQQPGNVLPGAIVTPEVQVQALGTNGEATVGAAISVSLGSGTGNLSGTLTQVTDNNGIAHFNDLSINATGPKTLSATSATGNAPPTNSNPFLVTDSPSPSSQDIFGATVNADGSITLTYATTPEYQYHVETTSNLFRASWATVNGSAILATNVVATFTVSNLPNSAQSFYRVVSP